DSRMRFSQALSLKSITGILRYGPARLINFTLGNWIEVVEVLEILSQSGQNLLGNSPSLQIVEPLRFETQFYSSFMHQPAHDLVLIDGGNASVRQGSDGAAVCLPHAGRRLLEGVVEERGQAVARQRDPSFRDGERLGLI